MLAEANSETVRPETLRLPPEIVRPVPSGSVIAELPPMIKLVILVVVARIVSETRLVIVEEAALTRIPAAVLVGARTLVAMACQAPLTPAGAPVLAMVIEPAPLVISMPEPAVKVAKTGSAPVEPMTSWPLLAWPKAVRAPVPEPSKTPPSVKLVAPVPPEATLRALFKVKVSMLELVALREPVILKLLSMVDEP